MKYAELVVVIAVGLGFVIGKWWEHDRRGGTVSLLFAIDDLEVELEAEQLANATLRGALDELRAAVLNPGGIPARRDLRHLQIVDRPQWEQL